MGELLHEVPDDDEDVLRLYRADEDPDYLVFVIEQEDPEDGEIITAPVALHRDDLPLILSTIREF